MKPIAIVGDFDANNPSHLATNDAIAHSGNALGVPVEFRWVGTEELARPGGRKLLADFSGFWIGPGSPYRCVEGALLAIRTAREEQTPLFGTCGGFQHVILEYVRSVLGMSDAEHEETAPQAGRCVISRLACSLVGRSMTVTLASGSMVARLCGRNSMQEEYRCNFGVNPDYEERLRQSELQLVGSDAEGTVRAVELAGHLPGGIRAEVGGAANGGVLALDFPVEHDLCGGIAADFFIGQESHQAFLQGAKTAFDLAFGVGRGLHPMQNSFSRSRIRSIRGAAGDLN